MTDEETNEGEDGTRSYYDVGKYASVQEKSSTPVPASILGTLVGRFRGTYDTFEGFWTLLVSFPLAILVPFGLLLIGLTYGALAFYAGLVATAAVGTFVIEKKAGRHMQFEEFSVWKRAIFVLPGFLVVLAVLALVLYATGRLGR